MAELRAASPGGARESHLVHIAALEDDKRRLKDMLMRLQTAQQQVNTRLLDLSKEVEEKDALITQLRHGREGSEE